MATGMYSWSQTAATNSTADSTINWAEGQAPSTVNDSARALMAVVSKWRDDISGVTTANAILTTGGSANVHTLTTNISIAALTNGWTVTFKAGFTNTTAATLAVDSLAAKQMQIVSGTNLIGGEILAGCTYTATYHQPADAWILNGQPVLATAAQMVTGTDTHRVPSISVVHRHEGVAKAWGNVSSDGTLNDSYGVTSVVKNSTGNYTVTMSRTMANATYAVMAQSGGGNSDNFVVVDNSTKSTTAFVVYGEDVDGTSTQLQDTTFDFVVFGTLA